MLVGPWQGLRSNPCTSEFSVCARGRAQTQKATAGRGKRRRRAAGTKACKPCWRYRAHNACIITMLDFSACPKCKVLAQDCITKCEAFKDKRGKPLKKDKALDRVRFRFGVKMFSVESVGHLLGNFAKSLKSMSTEILAHSTFSHPQQKPRGTVLQQCVQRLRWSQ